MKTWSQTAVELRAIDKYGDSIDLLGSYNTLSEARQNIPNLDGKVVAWVIERHTRYGACSGKSDCYSLLAYDGNMSALYEGGWLPREGAE